MAVQALVLAWGRASDAAGESVIRFAALAGKNGDYGGASASSASSIAVGWPVG